MKTFLHILSIFNAIFLKKNVRLSRSSHGFDISKQVLSQRISDIEKEYEQKYTNAKEQLKCDARLTVDEIVRLDESTE